jgi:sugar lactone lactonase YvrE
MMYRVLILLLLAGGIACKSKDTSTGESNTPPQDTIINGISPEVPGLRHLWDTEKTLNTCESVTYDKANNVLYVSCINGTPSNKKDGDGFIAKVGLDGKIITRKWVTGLDAPHGMAVYGNTLYVTDIDRLVVIDVTTGRIAKTWKVKDAVYLNDVAVAEDGTVYFTDSNLSSIYIYSYGDIQSLVENDNTLGGTNGIYVDGPSLMLACTDSGIVWRMDIKTRAVQKVATDIGAGDGIAKYKSGWLVSNWDGAVSYIGSDGDVMEILNAEEAKLNCADIAVIEDKNILLIPTFYGNMVSAYELLKQ